jgi:hypothetical protein
MPCLLCVQYGLRRWFCVTPELLEGCVLLETSRKSLRRDNLNYSSIYFVISE